MSRRDVSPILQKIRKILLGRDINYLRFRGDISCRTQPPPNLPDGPNAKLAANYYYTRDARKLVKPETVLVEGDKILKLPEGAEKPTTAFCRTPGKVHQWDI